MGMKGFKSTQDFPPAWVATQAKQTVSDMQWKMRIESYSFKSFHKLFLRGKKSQLNCQMLNLLYLNI